jgi:iron complex outermembrane recepter protein
MRGSRIKRHVVLLLPNISILIKAGGLVVRITLLAVAMALFASVLPVSAQAVMQHYQLNIPRQSLDTALRDFAHQTGLQVARFSDTIDGSAVVGPVNGELSAEQALKSLLGPGGLSFKMVNERTIAIVKAGSGASKPSDSRTLATSSDAVAQPDQEGQGGGSTQSFWSRFRLAQVDQGTSSGSPSVEKEKQREQASEKKPIQLEEVIVTATKREERLQDVPMSLAVISNQEIERRGLIGMEDYLRSIPGVNQIDDGPASNAIIIRGITTSPEFENFSSGTTVASYFDETPITGAAGTGQGGIDVRPVDLERIEVLRGPQGTAFGDASLGGTVRVIPVKPKLDGFSAKLAADYSNTSGFGSDNSMVQGVVNIPIVEGKFAVRAVAYRYEESGFYRNIAGVDPATIAAAASFGLGSYVSGPVQDNVGKIITTGGRLAALWQVTDKLKLSMNYLTQTIEQNGLPLASVGTYEQISIPVAPQARVRGEAGAAADTTIHLSNFVLNYDFGGAVLTSVASWVDAGGVEATGLPVAFIPFFGPSSVTDPSDFKSFTAETRLASHFDGRFQFLGGLFYEHVKNDFHETYDWPGAPAASPFGTNPLFLDEDARKLDQRAIFGEGSYNLTDKLTATVGGRYFKYDKNERTLQEGGLVAVPIGTGIAQNLESSEGHSTYKANLEYKPTKDSLLYALWSQGFRLGRPDPGAIPALCDPHNTGFIEGTNVSIESTKRINSDSLDNYEIGGKFTLFDHRMVLDTSIYHINWNGLPIRTLAFTNCGYTANVGAATSDGVEFQTSLLVMRGLRLDLGAGYTKAELSKDAPGLTPPAFKGDRLPGSPKVSANLAVQYDFDVAGYAAFLRADSFYTGSFYGDLLQSPNDVAGDYTKIDARAGVAIRNLSVELFVRNLTNNDAFTWRGLGNTDSFSGYRLRPRTIGVQLGYNFQ